MLMVIHYQRRTTNKMSKELDYEDREILDYLRHMFYGRSSGKIEFIERYHRFYEYFTQIVRTMVVEIVADMINEGLSKLKKELT